MTVSYVNWLDACKNVTIPPSQLVNYQCHQCPCLAFLTSCLCYPSFLVYLIPSPHLPPFKPLLASPQVTAYIKCIALFIGGCHKNVLLWLMSASAMHVELNIIFSALAWVHALLDPGLSSFGVICSFFVCLFIPLFVLDSLFILLAFYLMPLPSDTNLCHSFQLCTHCCTLRYH